jgi:energy coupling factor transporter S component ThiW
MNPIKKLALAGILVGVGVALSPFSIPLGIARAFPIQHMINVIAGVILGPWYAVAMAFSTSLIRNLIGTGTFLAFPGSMFGALLAGLAAKHTEGKLIPTCAGELIGTGILGAVAAYPVAAFIMGREASVFGFVIPFVVSSLGGALIAFVILRVLRHTGVFKTHPGNA